MRYDVLCNSHCTSCIAVCMPKIRQVGTGERRETPFPPFQCQGWMGRDVYFVIKYKMKSERVVSMPFHSRHHSFNFIAFPFQLKYFYLSYILFPSQLLPIGLLSINYSAFCIAVFLARSAAPTSCTLHLRPCPAPGPNPRPSRCAPYIVLSRTPREPLSHPSLDEFLFPSSPKRRRRNRRPTRIQRSLH